MGEGNIIKFSLKCVLKMLEKDVGEGVWVKGPGEDVLVEDCQRKRLRMEIC